ncbi:hypothetical protein BJY52DRAFT_1260901 [Lactarius psammicola]|nr:hypothetical protein BJY52DRAFT_1260901 [Lactarius psammicola]
MRSFLLYSIFFLPFTLMSVLAQSNNSNASSPTVVVSTSFSVGISFGPNRQPVTITTPIPVTLTLSPSTPTPSGNTTGNSTTPSNSTSSTSSPPTSTAPLPTAPTNVYGGGDGPGGAPSPGQSGQGGIFGPPDGYVSGVTHMQRNAMVVSLIGVVIGSLLSLL